MVKLSFDGVEHEVPEGLTVLQAAQHVGIEIPHYCYHPGLPIDGNCRMCLVEIEKMPKPAISCSTRVSEGMSVKTKTETVEKMRKSIMEFLLLNHPLDCPECDQAGECRLQEYYMNYDMQSSRLGEIDKVKKPKMVPLGPNVMLDAERCILCTRCIRFCNEISKTKELYIKQRGTHAEITTFPGQALDNDYATCTVDVCPVGALTSKDFRFKKRVWFLKQTPSICTGCATGCNITIDHADGNVYRYRPRHNPEVNAYWMCDEGRLSYRHLQERRMTTALVRENSQETSVSLQEAEARLVAVLRAYAAQDIAFVVSAQQSHESLAAVVALRDRFVPGATIYSSVHQVDAPKSDAFLIHADKNPNRAAAEAIGIPLAQWKNHRVALVCESLDDRDLQFLSSKSLSALVALVHSHSAVSAAASLVLPIACYWEDEGTFTNAAGLTQPFYPCFDPPSGVKTLKTLLGELSF